MNEKCSLVFTGGEGPLVKPLIFEKYPYSRIIAADSGYDTARKLSMKVDDAVGDFDSSLYRDELIAEGFEPCPRDKDYSDSELALMRLDCRRYFFPSAWKRHKLHDTGRKGIGFMPSACLASGFVCALTHINEPFKQEQ